MHKKETLQQTPHTLTEIKSPCHTNTHTPSLVIIIYMTLHSWYNSENVINVDVCKEWWNSQLTFGIWGKPFSHHPELPPGHQSHLLIPSTQTINQEKNKESRNEIQIHTNCILLPWPMYIECSPKASSDKTIVLKQGRNTQKKSSHLIKPGVTHGSQHLKR